MTTKAFPKPNKRAGAAFPPLISVKRDSARPLHRQIYDAFRAIIVARALTSGQPIPSTRALAAELGISRIPVLNAYAQLLAEGYFEARVGAGTFISSSLPVEPTPTPDSSLPSHKATSASRRLARASLALPAYRRDPWLRHYGAFSVSQPALDAFPLKAWANLVARHGRNPLARALEYGNPMGLMRLREVIAVYLRTSRAVRCEPAQIMIVSGSQQALDISARVLLNPGNSVWVEEPGYWLARHVLTAAGCRIIPVPVDSEGLDVAAGIQRCRTARAALVAPSHQFPLGVTMSASRRLQMLQWARQSGSWIIEDDYDSEYRYESKPIASLQGLDDSSRVIYVGTFSKVLFPSLRVGYLVIPPDLVDRFLPMRNAMDVGPPHLSQAVLADFIAEGHFARHIRKMRALYRERRNVLVDSLQRVCGSLLRVVGDRAGMYLAVTLPKTRNDREIALRAAEQSLWLWPLSPTYIAKPAESGFILGFGSTTTAEIPAAVRHLHKLIS
ncbi:MAG TPA: PLP-dependent aminotransferase family protein [Verrucomicrobiae bacterium]|nr:PLP-dependent aminotransferase family protein [Verrucomicrobiae bacterium]